MAKWSKFWKLPVKEREAAINAAKFTPPSMPKKKGKGLAPNNQVAAHAKTQALTAKPAQQMNATKTAWA